MVITNNFLTNEENKKLTFFEKKVKPKNFKSLNYLLMLNRSTVYKKFLPNDKNNC